MKISLIKLKISLTAFVLITATCVWGKPVGQVVEVSGVVFLVTPEGKTKTLKISDHIDEKSEVLLSENSTMIVNDYYDASYHLTEGGHYKFFDKSIQVKKGKTWVRSLNSRHVLALTTANGFLSFNKGEFIVTFDNSSSRSQVMVVSGSVEVSNILEKNFTQIVSEGTFTLIDPDVDDGLPRTPTRVGLESLNLALSEFKSTLPQIKPEIISEEPVRSIASVTSGPEPEAAAEKKDRPKGEIIFMTSDNKISRVPSSTDSAYSYFKQASVVPRKNKATSVNVRFYGVTERKNYRDDVFITRSRNPASLRRLAPVLPSEKLSEEVLTEKKWRDFLGQEKVFIPNHSKDLDNLLKDLKDY
jgi:hypothetical protein